MPAHSTTSASQREPVRWLARLCVERRPTLDDLRAGLIALEALPLNPVGAKQELSSLCGRLGVGAP